MAEVAIIMGSSSDWATMKETAKILDDFGLAYEKKVVSAHRTPALMAEFLRQVIKLSSQVLVEPLICQEWYLLRLSFQSLAFQ